MILIWMYGVVVLSLFSNEGTIDVEVSGTWFTFLYGMCEDFKRYKEFMRNIDSKSYVDHPWFIAGDFNEGSLVLRSLEEENLILIGHESLEVLLMVVKYFM